MAEARIVPHADRSPSGCVACGTQTGPFVDVDLTIFQMATASGVMDVDGSIYICVGTDERPGCLVQWARKTGLMIDTEVFDAVVAVKDELAAEVERLREGAKKKTISLEDAQKLFAPAA